jgi:hypothetical protein
MGNFARANGGRLKDSADRKDNDFYPTPPYVTYSLFNIEDVPMSILEPAAGRGWMAREMRCFRENVIASDLHEYERQLTPVKSGINFFSTVEWVDAVITNPPYGSNLAQKFAEHALKISPFVAMLCRTNFVESYKRFAFFEKNPPTCIHFFSRRFSCNEEHFGKNTGKTDPETKLLVPGPVDWEMDPEALNCPFAGMVAFAWFVWDYRYGEPTETRAKWIDSDLMYGQWLKERKMHGYPIYSK